MNEKNRSLKRQKYYKLMPKPYFSRHPLQSFSKPLTPCFNNLKRLNDKENHITLANILIKNSRRILFQIFNTFTECKDKKKRAISLHLKMIN